MKDEFLAKLIDLINKNTDKIGIISNYITKYHLVAIDDNLSENEKEEILDEIFDSHVEEFYK